MLYLSQECSSLLYLSLMMMIAQVDQRIQVVVLLSISLKRWNNLWETIKFKALSSFGVCLGFPKQTLQQSSVTTLSSSSSGIWSWKREQSSEPCCSVKNFFCDDDDCQCWVTREVHYSKSKRMNLCERHHPDYWGSDWDSDMAEEEEEEEKY